MLDTIVITRLEKAMYFKKQNKSFRQGLPESSHMDVNVAIHGTGYLHPGRYDERFAKNWIY